MSPVKLRLLSIPNCLFLPGSLNCCSQMNEVRRLPPSSVYWYESGLQNRVAAVTGFCMSEVGFTAACSLQIPCHLGCGSLAL